MTLTSDTQHHYTEIAPANGAPSFGTCLAEGFDDLASGFRAWPLWTMLAWSDVRMRYRRSTLGPFWITLSTGAFILLLGFIYAKIFNTDVSLYLPYVAAGLITWGFVSGTMMEATGAFTEGAGIIRQLRLPRSLHVLRVVWRQTIILAHNAVLMLVVWAVFGIPLTPDMLLLVPGVLLVGLNQIWLATIVAILSTRFRDVVPIVATGIQISMFATPIMWPVSALGDGRYIADLNPIFHLIELVRAPLLGHAPERLSWVVAIGMTCVGYLMAAWLIGRTRHRIVYWL